MAQPDIDTVLGWRGRTVFDREGEKIGKFDEIYLDSRTDLPEWAGVKTGLLGRERALVPLAGAEEDGDDLRVPFHKADVEAAPDAEAGGGELSQEQEAALYRHYGMDYADEPSDTVMPREDGGAAGAAATGRAEPGTTEGDDAQELVRSEEEVDMGVERRPRERVRMKKYVVTENVTKTVPVQREEVRLEREPARDDGES